VPVKPPAEEASVKRELDSLVVQMYAGGITYDAAVREFKKSYILEVLSHHKGNQCKAAAELGMHRNTLSRTISELQINPAQVRMDLKRPPRSERPALARVAASRS
jgi:DNA-binding NtrC family response regulator